LSILTFADRLQGERSHHNSLEATMKCICLGYYDEKKWQAMSELEWITSLRACLAYDEALRTNGHMIGGEALQVVRRAATLRWQNGTVSVTDGPLAETQEQLGGVLVLEAEDLSHAIRLMSKHPGIRLGGRFEIRPTENFSLGSEETYASEETALCNT
jgi:hypothetical protein